MPRAKKAEATSEQPAVITAYKGFHDDLTCRPDGKVFQYEIGKTYRHDGEVEACEGGFHVITGHPLALFQYYAPAGTRICQVEISGAMHSDDAGEKTAAEILTIGGKKPASKDVWQFPRHMLPDIEASIAAADARATGEGK